MQETHPDHGGSAQEFMRVVDAYRTLTHDRAAYDSLDATDITVKRIEFDVPERKDDGRYVWYKEPGSILGEEDERTIDAWFSLVMQKAHEFAYQGPIKVGMVEDCPIGFGIYDDVAVIAKGREPEEWAAETYILCRKAQSWA
jgi:hypothetical protein